MLCGKRPGLHVTVETRGYWFYSCGSRLSVYSWETANWNNTDRFIHFWERSHKKFENPVFVLSSLYLCWSINCQQKIHYLRPVYWSPPLTHHFKEVCPTNTLPSYLSSPNIVQDLPSSVFSTHVLMSQVPIINTCCRFLIQLDFILWYLVEQTSWK